MEALRFEPLPGQSLRHGAALTAVVQNEEGTLWFGTTEGLLNFNGYELSSNVVPELGDCSITTGAAVGDELWFGTARSGLFRVDRHGHVQQSYTGRADGGTLASSRICQVFVDRSQRVWVSCFRGGLQRFEPLTNQFEPILPDLTVTTISQATDSEVLWLGTLSGKLYRLQLEGLELILVHDLGIEVSSMASAGQTLWVSTRGNGIFGFSEDGEPVRHERFRTANPKSLLSDDVFALLVDERDQLWIGSDRGLSSMDLNSRTINHSVYEAGAEHGLMPGSITVLYEHQSALWVGGDQGDISRLSLDRHRFKHLRISTGNNAVYAGLTDRLGQEWLATGQGVRRRVRSEKQWQAPLSEVRATSLIETSDDAVWIGSRGQGVLRWQAPDESLTTYDSISGNLPHDHVTALCEDLSGALWVGTAGGGLAQWQADGFHAVSVEGLSAPFVTAICEDLQKRLWVGSLSGLAVLSPDRERVLPLPDASSVKLSGAVSSLAVGADGRVFVGTHGLGLVVINTLLEIEASYTHANSAIPSDVIDSLLVDESNDLWMATGEGLSRLSLATNSFENFDVEDGLQGRRFHPGAAWKGEGGLIYFGGPNGINEVDPKQLGNKEPVLRPVLRGLALNGEPLRPGPNSILRKPLMASSEIVFPYHESDRIGISYGTLDYANPLKSRFRYQLEGFEKEMSLPTADREAVYTSLPPDEYRFVVQSSPDGVHWHPDKASIKLVVMAPWYHRSWAKVSYALIALWSIIALAVLSFRRQVSKVRRQRERLELDNRRIEAALARQLQGSVLLDRTVKEIRHNLSRQHIFSATLRELAKHFGIDRSFVMLCSEGDDGEPIQFSLGAAHTIPGYMPVEEGQLPSPHSALFQHVLERDKTEAVADVQKVPQLLEEWPALQDLEAKSMLAVRTSYLDKPNGVIVLQQCSGHREWGTEELLLIDQVAAQVGVAIAQTDLQAREEKHRADLEEAKLSAEVANEAKSEFLAKITHELRTPLNAILGFCQLLHRDEETSAKQQDTLSIINSSGEHLLGMINDVLDMSKIEADCLELSEEPFDVQELAETLRGMFRFRTEEKSLSLRVEVAEEVPSTLRADVGKLRQTLINLMGNAVKFTDSGTLNVSLSMARESSLRVEVADTGRGIASEELEGLFDKFFQAEAGRLSMQGTGLGLAISRKFIEFMGGDIRVKSALGEGTTFVIQVPVEAVAQSVVSGSSREDRTRERLLSLEGASQFRVLVAEDQMANRLLLTTILRKAGFEAIEAVDGEDAVEKWEKYRPHLVFMDQNMPKMNGDEATNYLLERYAHEKPLIIALTASALEETKTLMLNAGCTDFLTKPYTADSVIDALLKHLPVGEEVAA